MSLLLFFEFFEFATISLLFHVLGFWLQGMWNLSSPTRDQTHISYIGRWSLNQWTTKEVLFFSKEQTLLSRVRLFATPWIAACQASLSITNSWSSLRLKSIESMMPSSHLIVCRPLLLMPPIPPSISLFQWVNSSHQVAKVLEFQLQHHCLQRNPRADLQNGLVGSPCSPRTLESLLQHHSSKASIFRHSAFFTVHLSHPYMTTG